MNGEIIRSGGRVPIPNIITGERFREELGDIDALTESIRAHGLLHPIVLAMDEEQRYTLVAGFRRLEAAKRLGWECIPYTLLEALPERTLREIELQENIRRKNFTEYELSKAMVALSEVVAEQLREEAVLANALAADNDFCKMVLQNPEADGKTELWETATHNPLKTGGRPSVPDNLRAIADRIGVTAPTVGNARAHVAAIEAHPELKEVPKMSAINAAKEANKLPGPRAQEHIDNVVKWNTGRRPEKSPDKKTSDEESEFNHRKIDNLIVDITTGSLYAGITPKAIDKYLNLMRYTHEDITDMVQGLDKNIEHLQEIRDYLKGKLRPTAIKGGLQ